MKKLVVVFICVALLIFAASPLFSGGEGGGKGGPKGKIVIGKIPITMEANYHQAHVKHLISYAEEKYGAEVTVIDGEFSTDASMAAVETFIAQGVTGILLHSLDEKVNDQMVKEARRNDIPITVQHHHYVPTMIV